MKNFISGNNINQGHYKSFQPSFINKDFQIDNMEIIHLLSQADREIGRLDMFSNYIPNIDLFISMHVLKEATLSSKIEGTQTKIDEILLDKEDIPNEKKDDWDEVQNYINAIDWAIKELKNLPISSRLIKKTHKILLTGVRGDHKLPGEFRKSQNWIGGASINDATFIPPVHNSIPGLMNDLEKFIHNENIRLPELLRIGLVHYQFETIHPFLDGNGRIGRLLITLYLVNKGIIKKPVLYLSDFFEKNRKLYYDNLNGVRVDNNIEQWLKFFLVGIIKTAQNGIETFDKILQLQKHTEKKLQVLGSRAANALNLVHFLYQKPIVNAEKASKLLNITLPTALKLVSNLEEFGILKEIGHSKRKKTYIFESYLNLFK